MGLCAGCSGRPETSLNASSASRILLVDDLALVRRMIPARLGALGREVDAVASAAEAREYLASQRPDLILLDVIMPGLDGLAFCRELKADPATRGIPVVILTDLAGNAHERSLDAGAEDYMPKRIDDAVMRIRVQLHMRLVDLRKQMEGQPSKARPSSILLATGSSLLGAQLPAQFATEGHRVRVVEGLGEVVDALRPEDRLLIVDAALGMEGLHGVLAQIRMDEATAGLPVLLLCEKQELTQLLAIEFMVDDVLWKPLKAAVNRHRLGILLELGRRTYGDLG